MTQEGQELPIYDKVQVVVFLFYLAPVLAQRFGHIVRVFAQNSKRFPVKRTLDYAMVWVLGVGDVGVCKFHSDIILKLPLYFNTFY